MNTWLPYVCSIVLFCMTISCLHRRPMKFDRIKWNERSDPAAPPDNRDRMVTDLTSNYRLKGLTYIQLIELLGEPDYTDSLSLSYDIIVDYGDDIDPVYTKYLKFKFSKDSVIIDFKIGEWEK